ncbi:putative Transmembrane protein 214 [Hypsibius exemplaris]|uniref:Transmembrane protein 214 n=1 Tax=Hypsibius exemplaris TaxID=2072580 RepID=A0A1W0X883_HYPEX|nr:putative Transmembrane protein 214 [Hypsibius exemplaris]
MDSDEARTPKDTWTTVGKKPVVKKDKSNDSIGGGILGSTKAGSAAAKAASQIPPAKKPEAIRIREEQLNRLKKKTAPLPEAMTRRSESDSGSSSDGERQGSSQREKPLPKKVKDAVAAKPVGKPGATLEPALKKIDYKALSVEVDKAKSTGQSGDAWLKLVANHLNEKLKDVPVAASFYAEEGFTWGYPLHLAPKDLVKVFNATFSSAPKNLLEGYLEWLITDARSNYLSKQRPVHGSQLVIQYLLSKNADLISEKHLNDRTTDLKSYASRKDETIKDETLFILWAYGQVGIASFSKGFDVWYKMMFPFLSDRRYTGFIVAYLEKLFQNHKKHDFGKINKAEVFLNTFDHFLGRNTIHFHKSTKAKISSSYTHLRELLFKDKLRDHAASYFAQFLMRLGQPHQPDKYYEAASGNLVQCLKADDKCLEVWRGKHLSSQRDSQLLLQFILTSDDDATRTLRRSKRFADFLAHLEEFEPAKGKNVAEGFKEEQAQTVELAKKIRQRIKKENRGSCVKKFLLFVFLAAAAVFGEVMYNTPKGSYAVHGYNVVKPVAIEYYTVTKPAVLKAWEKQVKPFAFWAGAESVKLAKYSFNVLCNLWASIETNLPQVYAVLQQVQDYLCHLAGQLGTLSYAGLRKFDHFLVDMPPLSQLAASASEKAAPVFDYARERLATGLVYAGHLVESYWAGNSTITSSSRPVKP